MKALKLGTRGSALALAQAHMVAGWIRAGGHPDPELVIIKTKGDKILDAPLAKIGGKGLFVREIEEALLDSRIDLAVHSGKDLPGETPEGLVLAAFPESAAPGDAFVSSRHAGLRDLPQGAIVGTCSVRRRAILRETRPDLEIRDLRGAVDTRLRKLDAGEFDALILAQAGLERLDLGARITERLPIEVMLPAPVQGVLALECRAGDDGTRGVLSTLDHAATRARVRCERAFLRAIGGGCQIPAACHAIVDGDRIAVRAALWSLDGRRKVSDERTGPLADARALGQAAGEHILAAGGAEILAAILGADAATRTGGHS